MAFENLAPEHLKDLLQVYWDTVSSARLLLCDSSGWTTPFTIEQAIASEILPENGYARGNTAPVIAAQTDAQSRGTRAFQGVTIAASGGTIAYSGYVIIAGATAASSQVCTATASNNRITSAGHGLTQGDRVMITADAGAALPSGLDGLTAYYANVIDTDTIGLLDAPSGATVAFTSDGSGTLRLRYAAGAVGPYKPTNSSTIADGDSHTFSPLTERLG